MRKRLLIIFLDAVPFYQLKENAPFLNTRKNRVPLSPGLGFSINLFPELFAGLTPDKIGFFNKWSLLQSLWKREIINKPNPLISWSCELIDSVTRHPQYFSRAIHKIYGFITRKGNLANIPFAYLPFFKKNTKNSLSTHYIFEEYDLVEIQHNQLSGPLEERDKKAFSLALQAVNKGNDSFVAFGYLDCLGHRYGPNSNEFALHLRRLDGWCEQLVEAFYNINGESSEIIICSDHGMASVNHKINLDLEQKFGKPSLERYFFFFDSVMLRVWVKSQILQREIGDFLNSLNCGNLLDKTQRKYYSIENCEFGDLIFILDEGMIFWPGWYGGWFPKGMHGYLPELDSQQAVFIYESDKVSPPLPSRSNEVYTFIKEVIEK